MPSDRPIGVFDSGLGGLSVLYELRRQMPSENYLYVGDSGRNPYGPRSVATVTQFTLEAEAFLAKAKQADASLEAAFLYEGDTLCGFTQATYDQVYVSSYKKRNGNYVVSVSTNETDNAYTLKVSPSNGLHGDADNILKSLLQKVAYMYSTPEGEILDIGLYQ